MNTLQHSKQPAGYGYLIDQQGREIPISEAMILKACQQLDGLSMGPGWLSQAGVTDGGDNSQSITGRN